MSDRKNESSIKALSMSTVGHAHIVAAEQSGRSWDELPSGTALLSAFLMSSLSS